MDEIYVREENRTFVFDCKSAEFINLETSTLYSEKVRFRLSKDK